MLLFVLLFCLVAQLGLIRYYDVYSPHFKPAVFTIICVIVFGAICCSPYRVLFRSARISLLTAIQNIVFTPFSGNVGFKEYMLAEVCVSMTWTLTLSGPAYCYFVEKSQPWRNNTGEKMEKNCTVGYNFSIVMGFIPLYIRFVQCLRKYYDSRNPTHLYNAVK